MLPKSRVMLTRSHSEYVEGEALVEMIREDLVAGRIAVESYSEIIRYLGDNDPTSKRMMEEILAKEEEYADDMKTFLERVGKEEVRAKVKPKSSEGGRHRRGS
jgi:bacterioferritin